MSEKIQTTNFSDLHDWSGKEQKLYLGTKKLDLKIGSKVLELLNEYDLGINYINEYDYLNKQSLLLPDEEKFKEYRVHISKKIE